MPPTAETDTHPALTWRLATAAGLLALIAFAFSGVLGNGWIYLDDHEYVTLNPHVTAGLTAEGFAWFLREVHVGNWHPLTSWSHMLDCELYGLSPRGPHAENLVLHALTTLVLVHVLFLYTRRWWASAAVAALFAVHPLRVESVAWISERKDVLSGLFFVLTLWAWRRWIDRPSMARMALTALALLLGLMSKSMLVTVPFLLLVLDVWPLARTESFWRRCREKWPLLALSAIFVPLTVYAQSVSGATSNLEQVPLAARVSTALTSYVRYLGSTFAPRDLAPMYPYENGSDPLWLGLAVLVLAVVTVVCVRARGRHPHLLTGWLWFLGMLVPVIGIVQIGAQSHADRYTYLPGIGLGIAVVFEVERTLARRPSWRIPVGLACGALLVALATLTRAQVALWHDSKGLFEHTLRVTKDNPTAHKIYGDTLLEAGDFKGAVPHYEEALRLAPYVRDGRKNLGCALAKQGRYDEAVVQFRSAIEIDPSYDNYMNLGWALGDAGRMSEALEPLTRAVALDDTSAPAHARLGMALAGTKRVPEGIAHLERAVELDPDDIQTRHALAIACRAGGDFGAAVRAYQRLLERSPDDIEALVNLARILATQSNDAVRNGVEAVRRAEHARDVTQQPFSYLYGALAAAYAEVGRLDEAVQAAARAVELARKENDAVAVARYEAQLAEHKAGRPVRTP